MDLRESFLHPHTEVRPRPLWLVEGDPSQERLEWLCGQLREKGLGGALLLPRPADPLAPETCAHIVRLGDAMGLAFRVLTASAKAGELDSVARALDAFTWDEATPHHLKHVADLIALSGQQAPLPWPLRSRVATGGDPPYAVSLFYQAPMWPYLGKLADYVARLNLVAQAGERLPGGAGLGTENTSLKAACWRSSTEAMVFVVNTGLQWTKGRLAAPQAGRVATVWNLEDGSIRPEAVNDAGEIVLHLAPMESRLYAFGPPDPALGTPAKPLHEEARLALTTTGYHFTPYGGNFLRLTPDDFGAEEATATFRTTKPLANLRVLADTAALEGATLCIDGGPLPPATGWEMDLGLGAHALPKPLSPGGHLVELRAAPEGPPAPLLLAQHVWLAGDFVADESSGIPELSPVPTVEEGAWEANGLAHFSGTAAYTADLDLPESARGMRVHLDAGYVAEVLEVEVNGQRAGLRLWPPYVVDITAHVRPGERNLVVLKVTNSLRNFLSGPDPAQPSGLLEAVEIVLLR